MCVSDSWRGQLLLYCISADPARLFYCHALYTRHKYVCGSRRAQRRVRRAKIHYTSDTRRHNQHSEFVCASCEECRALVCLAPALATLLWRLQWLHMRLREPDGARISSRAHELLQLCEHLRRDRVALFHRGQSPTFIRVGRSCGREAVVEDLPNEDTDQ